MIIKENFNLSKKTTIKIGGIAEKFLIPESEEELCLCAQNTYDEHGLLLLLSGGSNLLINDRKIFPVVLSMSSACTELSHLEDGLFYIGASNRIQHVISFVNAHGYGGFEGLVGLPALFGGIIYMNAGIGDKKNSLFTISEFVVSVTVWDLCEKRIVSLDREKCRFDHRYSLFHNGRYVILGATILCRPLSVEIAEKAKQERLAFCKKHFEYGKGCFGTLFSSSSGKVLRLVSIFSRLFRSNIKFANKNKNWLVNHGGGTFKETMRLINLSKFAHKLLLKRAVCEIVIWK